MDNFVKFVLFIIVYLFCIVVLGFPFMWLWNWIAPIFWASAPSLTYGQSVGTLLLLSFLKSDSSNIKWD